MTNWSQVLQWRIFNTRVQQSASLQFSHILFSSLKSAQNVVTITRSFF